MRKKLFGQLLVRTIHIHSDELYTFTDLSMITQEMVADDCLCSSI